MVEQKLPERAVSLFMKACEVAEVGSLCNYLSCTECC